MTPSRLYKLYTSARIRERKPIQPESTETEAERNKRVLRSALIQQQNEDARNASPKTRYTDVANTC